MPICKKCGRPFPLRTKINEKLRYLSKRRFCLECSPFKERDTSIENRRTSKICLICLKEFRNKGNVCSSCRVNWKKYEVKKLAVEYKGSSCQSCDYNLCIASLTFHHIDPTKKDFSIGGNHTRTFNSIKEELDKCILLCQNCHSALHYNESWEIKKDRIEKAKKYFNKI